MSIRKCKMATAILILLYSAKRGTFIDVLILPQKLHSQKLRTCNSQNNTSNGTFGVRPARTIEKTARTSSTRLIWASKPSELVLIASIYL